MAGLFGRANIRKQVLAAVEQKIAEGQEEFDAECEREDQHLAEGISALTMANTRNKIDAEKRIVAGIIS